MADEQQQQPSWRKQYGPLILKVMAAIFALATSAATAYFAKPDKVVIKTETVEKVVQSDAADYTQSYGWHRDEATVAENLDPAKTVHFDSTPAGKAVLGDEDVFLWRAVVKAANKGPSFSPWVNQGNVGSCVGCGSAHAVMVLLGVQVATGGREEWKAVSPEIIYGGSRVEVGGGRISGDGSVGAWAVKWLSTYGVVPAEKYPSVDLSVYSAARAREYGRRGCPDELESLAKSHPVKSAALVKTWAEVKKAVAQGYPVIVCSDVGFRMTRDSTGRCRPQGVWNHCMCICGVRGGDNEGGYVLNSWGSSAMDGPVWPSDAPTNGFWADASVIQRMVSQSDSFAISGAVGFPQQKIPFDWFIRNDKFARPFVNGVATR